MMRAVKNIMGEPWWWILNKELDQLIPDFHDGYKFEPAIRRLSIDLFTAREQLWAMEEGLAEWPLPAKKEKANGK